jgi:hypothetical protein
MIAMATDPSTSDWKLNAVARGLAYMTRDESTAQKLLREGVLDALYSLSNRVADLGTQLHVAQAVSNLSRLQESHKQLIDRAWTDRLLQWCDPPVSDEASAAVRVEAATCLLHLAEDDKLGDALINQGILGCLTLLAAPEARSTRKIGASIALELAKQVPLQRKLIQHNLLDVLLPYSLIEEPEAQVLVSRAIHALSKNDAIKVQVAQNDWLNRLVAWARSPNKDVRLQVASALHNLIQNDVIAMRVMEEFGAALFVSMADINDVHVQHVVEQCIQRLQRFTTLDPSLNSYQEYLVLPDDVPPRRDLSSMPLRVA